MLASVETKDKGRGQNLISNVDYFLVVCQTVTFVIRIRAVTLSKDPDLRIRILDPDLCPLLVTNRMAMVALNILPSACMMYMVLFDKNSKTITCAHPIRFGHMNGGGGEGGGRGW